MGAGDFYLHQSAKCCFGTHPAYCSMGSGGSFTRQERVQDMKQSTQLSSAKVRNDWSYASPPPYLSTVCMRTALLYSLLIKAENVQCLEQNSL
jgi:hypothetical protein